MPFRCATNMSSSDNILESDGGVLDLIEVTNGINVEKRDENLFHKFGAMVVSRILPAGMLLLSPNFTNNQNLIFFLKVLKVSGAHIAKNKTKIFIVRAKLVQRNISTLTLCELIPLLGCKEQDEEPPEMSNNERLNLNQPMTSTKVVKLRNGVWSVVWQK